MLKPAELDQFYSLWRFPNCWPTAGSPLSDNGCDGTADLDQEKPAIIDNHGNPRCDHKQQEPLQWPKWIQMVEYVK